MKLLWTRAALQDLEEIYRYYREKSPSVAANIHNTILDETNLLVDHPLAAPVESYIKSDKYVFRSLTVCSGIFKVVYFVDESKLNIVISQIFACRQSPEKIR